MNLKAIANQLRQIASDLEGAKREAPTFNRSLRLPDSQVFAEPQHKDLIVLHFTAGSTAAGAVAHWKSQPSVMGTAYAVERDGTIYEVFDPRYWAYHLGIATRHGTASDRRSIGIELVNVGPLKRRGDQLYWWPGDYTRAYCSTDDTGLYVPSGWRGMDGYATYTDAQYDALNELLPWLRQEFNIPADVLGFDADIGAALSHRGIASHHNFRTDKFDVGPAFDYSRLA